MYPQSRSFASNILRILQFAFLPSVVFTLPHFLPFHMDQCITVFCLFVLFVVEGVAISPRGLSRGHHHLRPSHIHRDVANRPFLCEAVKIRKASGLVGKSLRSFFASGGSVFSSGLLQQKEVHTLASHAAIARQVVASLLLRSRDHVAAQGDL